MIIEPPQEVYDRMAQRAARIRSAFLVLVEEESVHGTSIQEEITRALIEAWCEGFTANADRL